MIYDVCATYVLQLLTSETEFVEIEWTEVADILEASNMVDCYDPETMRVIWEEEYDFRRCPATGEVTNQIKRMSKPIADFVRTMDMEDLEQVFGHLIKTNQSIIL